MHFNRMKLGPFYLSKTFYLSFIDKKKSTRREIEQKMINHFFGQIYKYFVLIIYKK